MLNDYIGKKVRILVSSNSGAGAISADERYSNGVMTSAINFYGVIKKIDDKFIELGEVRYTMYSLDTEKARGFGYPINIDIPVFESERALVNINNVIAIVLI